MNYSKVPLVGIYQPIPASKVEVTSIKFHREALAFQAGWSQSESARSSYGHSMPLALQSYSQYIPRKLERNKTKKIAFEVKISQF